MAYGQNIGMAKPATTNERSRRLTAMVFTLLGSWEGDYCYFDEQADRYVEGSGTLSFTSAPMPNVLLLDAKTSRPSGDPVHAFSAMVVQSDGSSWRQMAFTPTDGRLQDKVITGFTYRDDRNWSVDMVEVQQGLGGVQAVTVKLIVENDRLDMRKFRALEGGAAAARPYESCATFARI